MKNLSSSLKPFIITDAFFVGFYTLFAWTGTTQTAPNGNVSAPINVGTSKQTKLGDLCINIGGAGEKCLSSNFIDTSASSQTKTGKLTILGGLTTDVATGTVFMDASNSNYFLNPDADSKLKNIYLKGIFNIATGAGIGKVLTSDANGNASWVATSTLLGSGGDGLGYGQTWQDMTLNRAVGQTYTNNTGKPIEVSIIFRADTGPNGGYVYVDGLEVWYFNSGNYVGNIPATIIIPNGSTYKVTTNYLIRKWNELR